MGEVKQLNIKNRTITTLDILQLKKLKIVKIFTV